MNWYWVDVLLIDVVLIDFSGWLGRLIAVVGQGRLWVGEKNFSEGNYFSILRNYFGELLFMCGNYFFGLEITFGSNQNYWKAYGIEITIARS